MRNFTDLYEETVEEKKSPSEIMQQRRKMARRMKLLARKSSTKIKKKRNKVRRRDADTLNAIAKRQAKQMVIKRSLGATQSITKNFPSKKEFRLTRISLRRNVRSLTKSQRKF